MTLEKGNLVVKVQDADDPAAPVTYQVAEVSPLVLLSGPARTVSPEPYVVALLRRADDLPAVPVEEPSPADAAEVPTDVPSAPAEGSFGGGGSPDTGEAASTPAEAPPTGVPQPTGFPA